MTESRTPPKIRAAAQENQPVAAQPPPADGPLHAFRMALARALFFDQEGRDLFDRIPDAALRPVFEHNFNGNMAFAQRVLGGNIDEIEKVDRARLDQEKFRIHGVSEAATRIDAAFVAGHQVAFLTDFDNDGSISQTVIQAYLAALPASWRTNAHVAYAREVGGVRGLNVGVASEIAAAKGWTSETPILWVTADNGVNNSAEWAKIRAAFPRSSIVVTDHHRADADVIVDDERTLVVNPSIRPTPHFQTHNISGADTMAVVLRAHLRAMIAADERALETGTVPPGRDVIDAGLLRRADRRMADLGRVGNLMDYVGSDLADKPLEKHRADVAMRLQPLLNTINAIGNIIVRPWTEEQRAVLRHKLGPEAGDVLLRSADTLMDLNRMAARILRFDDAQRRDAAVKTESDVLSAWAEHLLAPSGNLPDTSNVNAIEQLRPLIIDLSTRPNNAYEKKLLEWMVAVYEETRATTRAMMEAVRTADVLESYESPSASLIMPADEDVGGLFSRRFLNLAHNRENRGVLVVAHRASGSVIRASVRCDPDLEDVLKNKEDLARRWGWDIRVAGHAHAAGMTLTNLSPDPITPARLQGLVAWLGAQVERARRESKVMTPDDAIIETDLATLPWFAGVQEALRAHISNMRPLRLALRLPDSPKDRIWVTDQETMRSVSLDEVIRDRRFGYIKVAMDFDGAALLLPTEVVRVALAASPPGLIEIQPMPGGSALGSRVLSGVEPATRIVRGRAEPARLTDIAMEHRKNGASPVARDDLRRLPYFRYNRFGDREFVEWESDILEQISRSRADAMVVLDVEANGLGRAPKCFNLGGLMLEADPKSGLTMRRADLESGLLRDGRGRLWWIDPSAAETLKPLAEQGAALSPDAIVFRTDPEGGMRAETAYHRPSGDLLRVDNIQETSSGSSVVINRRIRAEALSLLVNEKDTVITPEFEALTGIDNRMLLDAGLRAATVDQRFVGWLGTHRNIDGEPCRYLMVAHNLPYDRGVIAANFPHLDRRMRDSRLGDTAKIARREALAYDSTPLLGLSDVPGVRGSILFCASPSASVSVATFLDRAQHGRQARLPDDTGTWMLWYKPDTASVLLVNREDHSTINLEVGPDGLMSRLSPATRPGNRIRFSVERMSLRAQVRNILLWDEMPITHIDLLPSERKAATILRYFQDQYHFDMSPEENIDAFQAILRTRRAQAAMEKVDMEAVAKRFLEVNGPAQARFHSAWMFERVLLAYDPPAEGRIHRDIIEQIAEQTSLPNRVIRDILATTVRYKRANGIHHALVHEQHNNLRFQSESGQGLADVMYEAALPTLLCQNRFRNPFGGTPKWTANRMVEENVHRAMIQDVLAEEYAAATAENAYSMRQMDAYARRGKTDRVKALQNRIGAKAGQEIKLAPPRDVLLPGQAVYARPRVDLDEAEIEDSLERLTEVLVNAQIETSLAKTKDPAASRALRKILEYNAPAVAVHADMLKSRFSWLDVERRDAALKDWTDWLSAAWENGSIGDATTPTWSAHLKALKKVGLSSSTFEAARRILLRLNDVMTTLGLPSVGQHVWEQMEQIRAHNDQARQTAEVATPDDPSAIRGPGFLSGLDIVRRNPMETAMRQMGVAWLSPLLRRQDEEVVETQDVTRAPRRKTAP